MPRWRSGSRTPSPSKKTSLSDGSKFCPVWTSTSSQARSRPLDHAAQPDDLRSGAENDEDLHGAGCGLARITRWRRRSEATAVCVDQVLGRAVLPASRTAAPSGSSGSRSSGRIGGDHEVSVARRRPRRLLLGDEDLVDLLARADADLLDLDPAGRRSTPWRRRPSSRPVLEGRRSLPQRAARMAAKTVSTASSRLSRKRVISGSGDRHRPAVRRSARVNSGITDPREASTFP